MAQATDADDSNSSGGWQPESEVLRGIAADPDFQSAVAYQNAPALLNAILPFAARRGQRNRRADRSALLVANYWQRYCTKNESVGFFGPIGWATIDPNQMSSWRPGPTFLDRQDVYFEHWPIDAIAAAVAAIPGVRLSVAPRRASYVRMRDSTVIVPGGLRMPVSPLVREVLIRSDGNTSAQELGRTIVESGLATTVEEVFATLNEVVRRRWIVWDLEVPVDLHPERWLRDWIDGHLAGEPRDAALALLVPVLESHVQVMRADDRVTELASALSAAERTFEHVSKQSATRHQGTVYGGRTLFYPEALRSGQAVLGQDFLRRLAPLGLVLDTVRWLTYETRQRVIPRLVEVFNELSPDGSELDLGAYWFEAMPIIHGEVGGIVGALTAEMRRTWRTVLGGNPNDRSVVRRFDEVAPAIRAAFDRPGPGWTDARWHSPDLMIAAESLSSLRTPDTLIVLGEIHAAINTLRYPAWVAYHPRPARMWSALDESVPQPRLIGILPKDSPPRLTPRGHSALMRKCDIHVSHLHHTVDTNRWRVVRSADIRVVRVNDGIELRLPDGSTFDVLDVFADGLGEFVTTAFGLVGDEQHTPRLQIDGFVLSRETWMFDRFRLKAFRSPGLAGDAMSTKVWRSEYGVPRFVFVKSPLEAKPFFADLQSAASRRLVERANRAIDQSATDEPLLVTEMLPGFDELWLTDARNRRFTSELRLVVVDELPVPTTS